MFAEKHGSPRESSPLWEFSSPCPSPPPENSPSLIVSPPPSPLSFWNLAPKAFFFFVQPHSLLPGECILCHRFKKFSCYFTMSSENVIKPVSTKYDQTETGKDDLSCRWSLMMMMTIMNCFLRNGWPTKCIKPYFQPGSLPKILMIANLRHATSRAWTCAESEFKLCWLKLYSSDKHCTTAQL